LSIVAAIASGHDAALEVKPGTQGGLEVTVRFARAPEADAVAASPPNAHPVGLGLVET
jgi:hypothetical protein